MIAAAIIAALLVLPWVIGGYGVYLLSLTGVFSLVATGLNLLTGLSGQISLGHAAFFAIGAYATGLLAQRAGVTLPLALLAAGLLSAAVGALAALPALRLRNLYLAIATLGLGTVVQKTLFEWRSVTGGGGGMTLAPPHVGGLRTRQRHRPLLRDPRAGRRSACGRRGNIVRGRSGRAMRMLRESEIAAGTLGISVARAKVTAFALSAFYAAIAGGLYAFVVGYVSPEGFGLELSISFRQHDRHRRPRLARRAGAGRRVLRAAARAVPRAEGRTGPGVRRGAGAGDGVPAGRAVGPAGAAARAGLRWRPSPSTA